MTPSLISPQVIAAARFNDNGTLRVANPTSQADGWLARYSIPVGTTLPSPPDAPATGDNCILSVQPDGSIQARQADKAGGWERCTHANGLATFAGSGNTFVFPCEP